MRVLMVAFAGTCAIRAAVVLCLPLAELLLGAEAIRKGACVFLAVLGTVAAKGDELLAQAAASIGLAVLHNHLIFWQDGCRQVVLQHWWACLRDWMQHWMAWCHHSWRLLNCSSCWLPPSSASSSRPSFTILWVWPFVL